MPKGHFINPRVWQRPEYPVRTETFPTPEGELRFAFQAQDGAGQSAIVAQWQEWCEKHLPGDDGKTPEPLTSPDAKPVNVNSPLLRQIARLVVMEVVDEAAGEQPYGLNEWVWLAQVNPALFFAISAFAVGVQELADGHEGNSPAAPGATPPGAPPVTPEPIPT